MMTLKQTILNEVKADCNFAEITISPEKKEKAAAYRMWAAFAGAVATNRPEIIEGEEINDEILEAMVDRQCQIEWN